ncbi:sigma 54-interacting transcriptional regulator [Stutzerimonas azotifigens]|uniref:sigma 54-interacting transcriptional regulator n=1 Tax=Stutzerimonas azotifigens TaxID=291995 RepID=UPI00041D6660|nr:sigma 54-interacting transcriptional regulator [Stutzerimonas azotifigens]
MPDHRLDHPPPLTFSDAERRPLSIRARALVFIDPRSRRLRDQVARLAGQRLPLLIEGEPGTGKELLARHVHRESGRAGLFVSVNCGAISVAHAEAELFGYGPGERRAGPSSRAGWFGSANGGTLYLDEIGDLPLPLQARLLAALETGEVLRVGAAQGVPVDVRLVAATSIDLGKAVQAGKFSEPLYRYLIDGRVSLPPLRERPGDLLPLAEYFLGVYAHRLGLPVPTIGPAAQRLLEAHAWPGNTRELENVIHFALLVSDGRVIEPEHLNLPERDALQALQRQLDSQLRSPDGASLEGLEGMLRRALEEVQRVRVDARP